MNIKIEIKELSKKYGERELFYIEDYTFCEAESPYIITGDNGVGDNAIMMTVQ